MRDGQVYAAAGAPLADPVRSAGLQAADLGRLALLPYS